MFVVLFSVVDERVLAVYKRYSLFYVTRNEFCVQVYFEFDIRNVSATIFASDMQQQRMYFRTVSKILLSGPKLQLYYDF